MLWTFFFFSFLESAVAQTVIPGISGVLQHILRRLETSYGWQINKMKNVQNGNVLIKALKVKVFVTKKTQENRFMKKVLYDRNASKRKKCIPVIKILFPTCFPSIFFFSFCLFASWYLHSAGKYSYPITVLRNMFCANYLPPPPKNT